LEAIRGTNINAARFVIDLGVDPNNNRDMPNKRSILREAIEENNPELVQLLLEKGADPNNKIDITSPPLIEAADRGNIHLVKTLLNYGSNVNKP
jgi:ankyrin repeat protein